MTDRPPRWFGRSFTLGLAADALPGLVERLGSAPDRLEDRLRDLPVGTLARRPGEAWSIAEHAGHLADLEPLWLGRVEDLCSGLERLRPADLDNRATWAAAHNDRSAEELVDAFRAGRAELVRALAELTPAERAATALHPRLEQPMSVADLCYFVAEHDDHHLATIDALLVDG